MPKFTEYHTIEPDQRGDGVWVVEHGEYPRSSVLAGQSRRALLQWFQTEEEAQAAFPNAEVLDHSTKNPWAGPMMSDVPEEWFDPLYAGEEW